MKSKHLVLLLMLPLSEVKSLFYNSDKKVSWYLFSDDKRYLCNVLEDYSNIIVMGIVFWYFLFCKRDIITLQIVFFIFILNCLDFVFLGLFDNNFWLLKLPISIFIFCYAKPKVIFQRF